ncbi:helix-turn-helix domain-containing protein [Geoalkalibacter halelectricus]|uniref:helix-turn-helix domain-containing protein n=1 Tax=Geoalkalibacter halelectricus TaxID=2847045 RepID=UPI003D23DA25
MSFTDPVSDDVVRVLYHLLEKYRIQKLAEIVGVHEDTIRKWYRRENLPRRQHWFRLQQLQADSD